MTERQAAGIVFGSRNACTRLEAEILAFGKIHFGSSLSHGK
jgi:hypothetical protein